MTKLSKQGMLTRERLRLTGLSRLDLLEEFVGGVTSEIIDDLMKNYAHDINMGYIVSCSCCNRDCTPGDTPDGEEDDSWTCEDCDSKIE